VNLEVLIKDITPANKREKLVKLARALSDQMGLGATIEDMEKGNPNHDQLGRFAHGAGFKLAPDTGGGGEGKIEPPLITGVTPIEVNGHNYGEVAKKEFDKLQKKINEGLFCSALDGRQVVGMRKKHLKATKGRKRPTLDIIRRVALLPYVVPVIENGILERKETEKGVSYKLTGRVEEGSRRDISVILIEDKKTHLLYFSVFSNDLNVAKSLSQRDGSGSPGGVRQKPFTPWGQGFLPLNHTLIIPQISAKSIGIYPNIELFIQNITPENRKEKFAKAIRAVSRRVGVPVSITTKHTHDGEPYFYDVQQELSDQWTGYYQQIIRKIYAAVIEALGLPPVEVETMSKALGDSGNLRYRGAVIYNPETGQPLKMKEFNALIGGIEKFLNRNTTDIAKRIVLDSVAVGKLLQRMAKYQSSPDMKRLKLDDYEIPGENL